MGHLDSEPAAKSRFEQLLQHPDQYLPVALLDTTIVGYAWVQNYGAHLRSGSSTARLHDLFVLSNYRKLSIGTILFQSVKTWAAQSKIRYLEWQASQAALGFYERLGYQGDPCPQPDYPFFEIDFG
jgi:GNAT superfamily N-acetyltransferase